MASSSSDTSHPAETAESITFMEAELYREAERGQSSAFSGYNEQQLVQLLTPNKNTVLHVYITTSTAGDTGFVEEILNICPSLLMQPNADGEIPLHLAARFGHTRVVKLLIERERGADSLPDVDIESGTTTLEMLRKTTKFEKDTALHEAVRFRRLSVVRILTKADPDFLHPANEAGETPFYLAAERGYLDLVREMCANCSSLNASGPNNRTALHAAVIARRRDMTAKILQEMPHLTEEADDKGCVPLHYAAKSKFGLAIVKKLLQSDRYAAYRGDTEGMTPLHIAATHGRFMTVKEIIRTCPDSCELVDNRGWSVLHFAAKSRRLRVVGALMKEPSIGSLLNKKDNEGNTPLHIAAPSLIPKAFLSNSRLDPMAFNKQNHNALDIATKRKIWGARAKQRLRKRGLKQGCRISIPENDDNEENEVVTENKNTSAEAARRESAREAILIVAALIATVTFAAGFTMPGGYVSDKGPLQGKRVCSRHS